MRYQIDQTLSSGSSCLVVPATLGLCVSLVLAGCVPEDDTRQASVRDAEDIPLVRDQIDRTRKGDRLAFTTRARPTLPQARSAAMRTTGARAPLSSFYRALGELKSGLRSTPVTVLHLGDSHIAADRFSGDLRHMFQARFGDAGRGAMMPGFPFPYYKARGVSFTKHGNWDAANSFNGDPGPYGLSGVRLVSGARGARLALEIDNDIAEWAEVVFLRQPGGGDATVTFGGAKRAVETKGSQGGTIRVRIDNKGRKLSVKAASDAPVAVLSWSVGQNRPGVRYVNFGIPGATADTPRKWDAGIIADGLANLKPDLIVLGYGTNEGFNDGLNLPAYEKRVAQLVQRLNKDAPQASVLVLGPPDSARLPKFARSGGDGASERCGALSGAEADEYAQLKSSRSEKIARWHAPPNLERVRDSLEKVATASGARFWDWSKVMGGPCGIHAWAQAEPPLAASDHVHLRSAGAKRSAQALFSELMAGYDAHVRLASR